MSRKTKEKKGNKKENKKEEKKENKKEEKKKEKNKSNEKVYNTQGCIRSALRRAFSRSPPVQEVLRESKRVVPRFNKDGSLHKKGSVEIRCNVCAEWTKASNISVDHVDPVIPPNGFTDWNTFIERLFCEKGNLQCICKKCHQAKTNHERCIRNREKDLEELSKIENLLLPLLRKEEALLFFSEKERETEIKKIKASLRKYMAKGKHPEVKEKAKSLWDEK